MIKKPQKADSTLALIAGTLADAIMGRHPKRTHVGPPARPKVYLADNSRLRPEAELLRTVAEEICDRHALIAEWPSEHFLFPTGLTIAQREKAGPPIEDPAPGRLLHKAWYKIMECAAVIAEVTPFRGSHLNPVVAFEIGTAVAHEIPVFAWSAGPTYPAHAGAQPGGRRLQDLLDRIWGEDHVSVDGNWRDEDGNLIENFNMTECAAIAGNFVSVSMSLADAIGRCAEYLK